MRRKLPGNGFAGLFGRDERERSLMGRVKPGAAAEIAKKLYQIGAHPQHL